MTPIPRAARIIAAIRDVKAAVAELESALEGDPELFPPEPKAAKVTWLTPFVEVWQRVYGGEMAIKHYVGKLKRLVDANGEAVCLRRFENCLRANPFRFMTPEKFFGAFTGWDSPAGGQNGSQPYPNAQDTRQAQQVIQRPVYDRKAEEEKTIVRMAGFDAADRAARGEPPNPEQDLADARARYAKTKADEASGAYRRRVRA